MTAPSCSEQSRLLRINALKAVQKLTTNRSRWFLRAKKSASLPVKTSLRKRITYTKIDPKWTRIIRAMYELFNTGTEIEAKKKERRAARKTFLKITDNFLWFLQLSEGCKLCKIVNL